ncbi:MAG: YicC/YloC family endoribonuclease [Planctomycetota bacterium]
MLSMTGYGSASERDDAGRVTMQVAVVNHRHCQVHLRSDLRDVGLENAIRKRCRDVLGRGSVNVQLLWEPGQQLPIDLDALRASWQELAQLAAELGAPTPRLEDVARLQQRPSSLDVELVQNLAMSALDQALTELQGMRRQEGQYLTEALQADLRELARLRQDMGTVAAQRVPRHQALLRERLQELLQTEADLEPATLVREMALYADRIDISEELVRLDSHLEQMAMLLSSNEEVGKRIEFLLQELGREINTTGSKANDADLTARVVAAKSVLERMREQVANIL